MKTQWQVKSYTSSLGETGDQFTESWIENGELKLIASSDLESDEELHEIANALNSFETLDQQNKEFRERIAVVLSDSALGVEIQRLTTENKELEEKLMSEQIENGYLQAFKVSNEAEIQRLTKEVEELKRGMQKLPFDTAADYELCKKAYQSSSEHAEGFAIKLAKADAENTRLRELLGETLKWLQWSSHSDAQLLASKIDNALNHKP